MAVTDLARPTAKAVRTTTANGRTTVRTLGGAPRRSARATLRLALLRLLAVTTVLLGAVYLGWRWAFSLDPRLWWIAVPLAAAETYTFLDTALLAVTTSRARRRVAAEPAPAGLTVDVLITTYDEPAATVLSTARAALGIRYPHRTWILDDGNREVLRLAAEVAGIGYIARAGSRRSRPVHAEAGSLNNALMATDGEFLLLLAADQVPLPQILDATLGRFNDPRVAFVQTPQTHGAEASTNALQSAPPMYFGSIQQGDDGWNAAQFNGSNAVVRRDALMQLGITRYVADVEHSVNDALRRAGRVLARARADARRSGLPVGPALDEVTAAVRDARASIKGGAPLDRATFQLQRRVDLVARGMVSADIAQVEADLAELQAMGPAGEPEVLDDAAKAAIVRQLAMSDVSPLAALETVRSLLRAINVDRAGEEQELMPLAKLWVTEDLLTGMRLHGLGWKSVYDSEVLVDGLEPADFGELRAKRLRRAQGAVTMLLRESPLFAKGLRLGQRLTYLATPWSYLAGFASVVYLAAPVVVLASGALPISTTVSTFALWFLPYICSAQLLLLIASGGPFWRYQQHGMALFPTWIRASWTAFSTVVLRRRHGRGTADTHARSRGAVWRVLPVQTAAAVILTLAVVGGALRLVAHLGDPVAVAVALAWAGADLLALAVAFRAARYRGYRSQEGQL